jgi:hypothetical protein
MKKRGRLAGYIRKQLWKGHSKEEIREHLLKFGHNDKGISKGFADIRKKNIALLAVSVIFLVLAGIFIFRPSITGMAVSDTGYAGLKSSSAAFQKDIGVVYQGVSDTEHIYKEKTELSIRGKQKGSVNIVDYNHDSNLDLFSTGFYMENNEEKAETAL